MVGFLLDCWYYFYSTLLGGKKKQLLFDPFQKTLNGFCAKFYYIFVKRNEALSVIMTACSGKYSSYFWCSMTKIDVWLK